MQKRRQASENQTKNQRKSEQKDEASNKIKRKNMVEQANAAAWALHVFLEKKKGKKSGGTSLFWSKAKTNCAMVRKNEEKKKVKKKKRAN